MNYRSINFQQKFGLFREQWLPKVVAEMNDYQFKVVKLQGDFIGTTTKTLMRRSLWWRAICGSIFEMARFIFRRGRCSWFQRASSTSPTQKMR